MDRRDAEELHELLQEANKRGEENRLKYFKPYPYQVEFIKKTKDNAQVLLMAGNRVGKSEIGAFSMACHLTGRYPDWWEGRRFDQPISAWGAGETNETTRDIVQHLLFGPPDFPDARGTGYIPKDCIIHTTRKPQIPNALSNGVVKHVSGGYSRIAFKAYEMGMKKFMGEKKHYIWLDEEPPRDIFMQCITRTADTGGLVNMTFTPERGPTAVVSSFMNDLKPGQAIVTASWDDAPHLTEKVKQQLLSVYPAHERAMRSKGQPFFGSGLVYPYPEEHLLKRPFHIPEEWPRLVGMDFGWEHPTAAVWAAWDRDNDTVYIYDIYKSQSKVFTSEHATVIRSRGDWIPISWPHDGEQTVNRDTGISKAKEYRDRHKLNMLPKHFQNPTKLIGQSNTSKLNVEVGVNYILGLIEERKLKVFDHLDEWFKEYRQYHRKHGKIVAYNDDLMSATRYAVVAIQKAMTKQEAKSYAHLYDEVTPEDMKEMGLSDGEIV